jgi:hypothetical protein
VTLIVDRERNVPDVSSVRNFISTKKGNEKNLTYAVQLYDTCKVIRFASQSAKLSSFLDFRLCSG